VSRPGVLLVTRRYWPLPGGWEKSWSRLLDELSRRGRRTTVLTPRWQADWPDETLHGAVRIVRLPPPARGRWGEIRYLAQLANAVGRMRSEFDLLLTAGLRGDAYATIGEGRKHRFPVALVAEQPGLGGDCHWQLEACCGSRIKKRCYQAQAYPAATPLIERELIAAGYARSRIRPIPLGVPPVEPPTFAARREARRALAQADPALALGDDEPLVVCIGRLRMGKGLDVLLNAWRQTSQEIPRATLWLVGEGPDADYLRERIVEFDLTTRVRLTGAFDDIDDVYRSADVAVFPALEDGPAVGLLEAASYGLPIVASDVVTHRERLDDQVEALVYPRREADALATALGTMLRDYPTAARLGTAARRCVAENYTLTRMADDYERLLDELTTV